MFITLQSLVIAATVFFLTPTSSAVAALFLICLLAPLVWHHLRVEGIRVLHENVLYHLCTCLQVHLVVEATLALAIRPTQLSHCETVAVQLQTLRLLAVAGPCFLQLGGGWGICCSCCGRWDQIIVVDIIVAYCIVADDYSTVHQGNWVFLLLLLLSNLLQWLQLWLL